MGQRLDGLTDDEVAGARGVRAGEGRLRFATPGATNYRPGTPIEVLAGGQVLGVVRSARLSTCGGEISLGEFESVDLAVLHARGLIRLIVAEVVAFVAQSHPAVHSIGILLSRDVEVPRGTRGELAAERGDLLRSIGAQHVNVVPRPHPSHAGHFAVSGIWRYDSRSLAALDAVLSVERVAYDREVATVRDPAPAPGWRGRSVFQRVLSARS